MANHQNTISPIFLWMLSHLRALLRGIGELLRTPFASLMTLLVIAIATALPIGLYVFLKNLERINQYWNGQPTLTLYLQQDISPQTQHQLMAQLKNNTNIADAKYISPEQGLLEFEQSSELHGISQTLIKNPLPGVIIITPASSQITPEAMQNLLDSLKPLPGVASAELDRLWIQRLFYIVNLGKRLIYALMGLFGLGVVLIIGNTIKLTTANHHQEITVLQLIGASTAFIRRPMLYRGFFYGLFGGAIAWLFIGTILFWLKSPAQALAVSYNQNFLLQGLTWETGLISLAGCAFLGWLGSLLAVNKHLLNS